MSAMPAPMALSPCPFCEGPPVPTVQNFGVGGVAPLQADYGANGLTVKAFVFCHECGAEGPAVDDVIYDEYDYLNAEAEAVRLWQQRNNRHRCLFDSSAADGLNLYPRQALLVLIQEERMWQEYIS